MYEHDLGAALGRDGRADAGDPHPSDDYPLHRTASGRWPQPARTEPESSTSGRWRRGPWTPSDHVVAFSDADFERIVLGSTLPVVVDFWAEHCVPCRRQETTLEQLGQLVTGRARVGRVNVYDSPRVTEAFDIRGVPHLLVVDGGQVVLELVGDHSLEQLRSKLQGVIAF